LSACLAFRRAFVWLKLRRMPNLLIFALCERVIVEQGANTISLIAVMNDLTVPVPAGAEIPPNAAAPQRWYVLTMWHRQTDESGRRFEQRVELIGPSGQTMVNAQAAVTFPDAALIHRNVVTIEGFPIGFAGAYTLRLSLREADQEWVTRAEYPLKVVHHTASAAVGR
jgi:hypothetical protein